MRHTKGKTMIQTTKLLTTTALLLLSTLSLSASTLSSFEEGLSKENNDKEVRDSHSHRTHDHGTAYAIRRERDEGTFFEELLGHILFETTRDTWQKVEGAPQEVEPRKEFDPLLPFISMETRLYDFKQDIDGIDYRMVAGYGPFALSLHRTELKESNPSYTLTIEQLHFLYRVMIGDSVETGLGVGEIRVEGSGSHVGNSALIPLHIKFTDRWSASYYGSWAEIAGNNFNDNTIALNYSYRFLTLQAGYRQLETGNQHIEGTFIGLSLHY